MWVKRTMPRLKEDFPPLKATMWSGKLGCVVEGAGKRRLFAIGLCSGDSDGTFDQTKPAVCGKSFVASYDFSSATDRWPVLFIYTMMTHFFGSSFAEKSFLSALTMNFFRRPFLKTRQAIKRLVCFAQGQPLGSYSSWALFALSHHMMVWFAAKKVYPGSKFLDYGILGRLF
ncbi:hypothetical protein KSP40_PGU001341 [Platanthera guangdongensis]|uniref:Uncharacterized protein n=1 Tax=Platanthera guangdongensis TaxID=2320717 RepID=A0ABR2MGD0_9ASPA